MSDEPACDVPEGAAAVGPGADGTRWMDKRPPSPRREALRLAPRVAGALYVLVLAALVAGAAWESSSRMWLAALLWLIGLVTLGSRFGVRAGWELLREAWDLRRRGLVAEGTRTTWPFYAFTDASGTARRLDYPYGGGRDRVEILYDPLAEDVAKVGRRTAGDLAFAAFVLLTAGAISVVAAAVFLAAPLVALGLF